MNLYLKLFYVFAFIPLLVSNLAAFTIPWTQKINNHTYTFEHLNEGDFSKDKQVCINAFSEAYKSIPLEALQVNNLTTFLENAFESEMKTLSQHKDTFYYVHVKDNDNVVGFITFEQDTHYDEKTKSTIKKPSGYISLLAVDPSYAKKGIGKTMVFDTLRKLVPNLQEIVLQTRSVNTIGRKFYEKLGFKEVSTKHQHEGINLDLYVTYKYTFIPEASHHYSKGSIP